DLDVLARQRLLEIREVGDIERPGQPLVEFAPAPVDAGLVGDGDEAAARVGGEGGRVVLLVRVAAADEEDAVTRFHGVPPASAGWGLPERGARSGRVSRVLSGAAGGRRATSGSRREAPASW